MAGEAVILADFPPIGETVTLGAFEGEIDGGEGDDLGGGIPDVNTGVDRGALTSMTDGLVSDTDVFLQNEITPSMGEEGGIAPEKSNCADEAASRDSIGTDNNGARWRGNQLSNDDKSEECGELCKRYDEE